MIEKYNTLLNPWPWNSVKEIINFVCTNPISVWYNYNSLDNRSQFQYHHYSIHIGIKGQ